MLQCVGPIRQSICTVRVFAAITTATDSSGSLYRTGGSISRPSHGHVPWRHESTVPTESRASTARRTPGRVVRRPRSRVGPRIDPGRQRTDSRRWALQAPLVADRGMPGRAGVGSDRAASDQLQRGGCAPLTPMGPVAYCVLARASVSVVGARRRLNSVSQIQPLITISSGISG